MELRGPVGGHFIWRSELGGPVQLVPGGSGVVPFLGRTALQQHVLDPAASPQLSVCGPTGFVETVSTALVELGHPSWTVNTERFGDTR